MKKPVKVILCILLALLLIAGGYVAYVFIDYHRLDDNLALTVSPGAAGTLAAGGGELKLVSWNIGFGAYTADYDFFMDGGTQSWAESPERLDANLKDIAALVTREAADLYLIQEVDVDGTRSYHVDESVYLTDALTGYDSVFAQNYDSPFLAYPFTQPHGANKAGIMTFSRFPIEAALRRSLPIEDSVMKLVDLDRCYSISHIPLADGGELTLFNLHLSAYTSDGTIANEQLQMLLADMQRAYDKGHYCIAGGDFNKDVLGDSPAWFGTPDTDYSWAQPIPDAVFAGSDMTLVAPLDENAPVPSCRNPDSAYHEGQYVVTVDGFLVSPNVTVTAANVIDTGFAYSDHNPVMMTFTLD